MPPTRWARVRHPFGRERASRERCQVPIYLSRRASREQGPIFTEALARKLEVERVLSGHAGCVNRLAWSEDGGLLASASDDLRVRCRCRKAPGPCRAGGSPG